MKNLDEILDIDLMTTTRVHSSPLGFEGAEISARTILEEHAKDKLKASLIEYIEGIIGGDEECSSNNAYSDDDVDILVRNELRAEQRAKLKEQL